MKRLLLLAGLMIIFQTCDNDPEPESEKNVAMRWADLTLKTIQNTAPNSPTYTSRSLGYLGVTMYESVVHGSSRHKSLTGQLNGLNALPMPDSGREYNWIIVLNAGQADMLKRLYPHADAARKSAINALETRIYEEQLKTTSHDVADRSVGYGKQIAEAIFAWAITDGGHEGYLRHFDPEYQFPIGFSYWMPPAFGQTVSSMPLHPHWGNNRTFIPTNGTLPVPQKIAYSNLSSSDYYKLFDEVYKKVTTLTFEEKKIAAWWADDPTESASPPGHSYNLASIAIKRQSSDLFTSAEVYAKVGISVADAFICCWKCKYTYHSERPYAFIRTFIDQNYQGFWPEPPFPAFSSGHATQSAASARALISVYGNNVVIIDDTHRHSDALGEYYSSQRMFSNIWQTAEECAYSRFLGGIHTRHDNETGTEQGTIIGNNVAALTWYK